MSLDELLSMLKDNKEELQIRANEKRKETYNNRITFSRNLFVPVTHQCRNRCGYCGFVNDDPTSWITPEGLKKIIVKGKKASCSEVLLTLGEKPEEKYDTARAFLKSQDCSTTVDYVIKLCEQIIENKLLPHSNLGVVSFEELSRLKEFNASLGLMLETISTKMLEAGKPHQYSPGKDPNKRLRVIEDAGKLQIPFTTGILVGIGENW
ncbi:MAG: 7,8-didemethyl-8-hydroxy-5-deazariboflavin synthase subunit CofG [Candidatus Heimdallarchaeaceae archaeon]|jgi:7,8-didemethyl-8-hydroxy-5-deazariboflavin synthase CofG subunit